MSPAPKKKGGRPPRRQGPGPRSQGGGPRGQSRGQGRGGPQFRSSRPASDLGGDQIEGRRAVIALLEARKRPITKVMMATELDGSDQLDRIEELCRSNRIMLEMVSRGRIDKTATTESHQGVLALARPLKTRELDELLSPPSGQPFLLICDGVTDPHNLGSLLRTAECAGVTGVVLPRHRSARVSPTVAKVAAGAIEHLEFASVAGIPSALDQLTKAGVTVVGLAGEAKTTLWNLEFTDRPVAIVIGSEEKGLAALSRKRCTTLASIPQAGSIESLNASVAGAVAMYEIARQRG